MKHSTCEICFREFYGTNHSKTCCKPGCLAAKKRKLKLEVQRIEKQRTPSGYVWRPSKGVDHSASVGTISELAVACFLIQKGWSVFRALSSSCFCDLIAFKSGRIRMIEVRTAQDDSRRKNFATCNKVHPDTTHVAVFRRKDNAVKITRV